MKAELKLSPHSTVGGAIVAEVWYRGQMIATIYGADGPGVRVVSKHQMTSVSLIGTPNVSEVYVREKG